MVGQRIDRRHHEETGFAPGRFGRVDERIGCRGRKRVDAGLAVAVLRKAVHDLFAQHFRSGEIGLEQLRELPEGQALLPDDQPFDGREAVMRQMSRQL